MRSGTYIVKHIIDLILQWNLLIRTLENEDTCIIWTVGNGPKLPFYMWTILMYSIIHNKEHAFTHGKKCLYFFAAESMQVFDRAEGQVIREWRCLLNNYKYHSYYVVFCFIRK